MKVFLAASKHQYHAIPAIAKKLKEMGHVCSMPNSFDDPFCEEVLKTSDTQKHIEWKKKMLLKDEENIAPQDAILVINVAKDDKENYIGGATFLEIFTAFRLGKKIFFWNEIPESIFKDELVGMQPIIIEGDCSKVV